jgi:3-oxoadipate enol-lactonase
VPALVLGDTRAGAEAPAGRAARATLAAAVMAEGARAAADAFLPKLLGATTQRERPEVAARVRAIIEGNPPQGIANAALGLGARDDSTPTLAALRVPTLVLVGEEDTLTPPSESEAMARAIPGADLAVIPGAGHLANLENPAAYQAALRAFLARI